MLQSIFHVNRLRAWIGGNTHRCALIDVHCGLGSIFLIAALWATVAWAHAKENGAHSNALGMSYVPEAACLSLDVSAALGLSPRDVTGLGLAGHGLAQYDVEVALSEQTKNESRGLNGGGGDDVDEQDEAIAFVWLPLTAEGRVCVPYALEGSQASERTGAPSGTSQRPAQRDAVGAKSLTLDLYLRDIRPRNWQTFSLNKKSATTRFRWRVIRHALEKSLSDVSAERTESGHTIGAGPLKWAKEFWGQAPSAASGRYLSPSELEAYLWAGLVLKSAGAAGAGELRSGGALAGIRSDAVLAASATSSWLILTSGGVGKGRNAEKSVLEVASQRLLRFFPETILAATELSTALAWLETGASFRPKKDNRAGGLAAGLAHWQIERSRLTELGKQNGLKGASSFRWGAIAWLLAAYAAGALCALGGVLLTKERWQSWSAVRHRK